MLSLSLCFRRIKLIGWHESGKLSLHVLGPEIVHNRLLCGRTAAVTSEALPVRSMYLLKRNFPTNTQWPVVSCRLGFVQCVFNWSSFCTRPTVNPWTTVSHVVPLSLLQSFPLASFSPPCTTQNSHSKYRTTSTSRYSSSCSSLFPAACSAGRRQRRRGHNNTGH